MTFSDKPSLSIAIECVPIWVPPASLSTVTVMLLVPVVVQVPVKVTFRPKDAFNVDKSVRSTT